MPTKEQMNSLGGREEHLGAGRGVLQPTPNPFPTEFKGHKIGTIVIDEETKDFKIIVDPIPESPPEK